MQASTELRLMLAPAREYERLARAARPGTVRGALARPALAHAILAAAVTIAATSSAEALTILSVGVCWIFVPGIQAGTAFLLVRPARVARVDALRAFELLSLAHGPWSLWMLAAAAVALAAPDIVSLFVILATALAPSAWTAVLMRACCERVLGLDRRRAIGWTLGHQCVTWSIIVAYLAAATQLWPRVLGGIAP